MSIVWNPWHGCSKISEGCKHCYVYCMDTRYMRDASEIKKNKNFNLPIQKNRQGEYKIPKGTKIFTCFTSDLLHETTAEWLNDIWDMIRIRNDCHFLFLTKRIHRFHESIPQDWGDGWDHITIGCTCENQKRVDERLPVFIASPIKHKIIICEPLLEAVDLTPYLDNSIEEVCVGGESGQQARLCDYEWILSIREQCIAANVNFYFKQTGANFKKNDMTYHIPRKDQHTQAKQANINYYKSQERKD